MLNKDLVIFKTHNGEVNVDVRLEQDTLWLSLNQLAEVFERDNSVISRHLKNIFAEDELEKDSVVAKFATTATDGKIYQVEYYNLDAIISVGYKVNSKRGTQFRQWASRVLKNHLVQGYSLNQQRLYEKGIDDFKRAISLLSQTLQRQSLVQDVGHYAIEIINQYAKTWHLLLAYDENSLTSPATLVESTQTLSYDMAIKAIHDLKETLMKKGEASPLFGQQPEEQLQAIFGTIHQTFAETLLYPSCEERAAHLLYFVIKDHPFIDGNKRIGSFLFLLYLQSQSSPLEKIDELTLVALALLIAESNAKDKDLMIKLIVNLIAKN